MTAPKRDYHRCHLVTITGTYLTANGTFSEDPNTALQAERWWLQREQRLIKVPTIIIRAA